MFRLLAVFRTPADARRQILYVLCIECQCIGMFVGVTCMTFLSFFTHAVNTLWNPVCWQNRTSTDALPKRVAHARIRHLSGVFYVRTYNEGARKPGR